MSSLVCVRAILLSIFGPELLSTFFVLPYLHLVRITLMATYSRNRLHFLIIFKIIVNNFIQLYTFVCLFVLIRVEVLIGL